MKEAEKQEAVYVDLDDLKLDREVWSETSHKLINEVAEIDASLRQLKEALKLLENQMKTASGEDAVWLAEEYAKVTESIETASEAGKAKMNAAQDANERLKAVEDRLKQAEQEMGKYGKRAEA